MMEEMPTKLLKIFGLKGITKSCTQHFGHGYPLTDGVKNMNGSKDLVFQQSTTIALLAKRRKHLVTIAH